MNLFHRSHLILFLAAAAATGFLINSLHAATPPSAGTSTQEEQAVMAPITAMFDGMAKRDAAAIRKPLLPGGSMVLMRDGKPTQMTFDAFAEAVGKPGKAQIEERIHDPLVRIDNDLAVVWAPFEFLVDGKVDHCGTDLFNLVRTDGKWLIASVAAGKFCNSPRQMPTTTALFALPVAATALAMTISAQPISRFVECLIAIAYYSTRSGNGGWVL